MSWTLRYERFGAYLTQVVDDAVPADVLEAVKRLLAENNSTITTKDVQIALRSIRWQKYSEYSRTIADRLNGKVAIDIPDDLRAAMLSEFATISSYQVHRDACDNPTRLSLPPMSYVARKLAIELGASPDVIGIFPVLKSAEKLVALDAYWMRLHDHRKRLKVQTSMFYGAERPGAGPCGSPSPPSGT